MLKITMVAVIVSFCTGLSFAQDLPKKSKQLVPASPLVTETPEAKPVLVNKHIYGGDRTLTLKGKIRNISITPAARVIVRWEIRDNEDNLIPHNGERYIPAIYEDIIDFLDGKSEADIEIMLDLYSRFDSTKADLIRNAIRTGHYKIVINKQ